MTEDRDYVYKAKHYPGPPVLIPTTIEGCRKMIVENKGLWCTHTWEDYLMDRMEILRLRARVKELEEQLRPTEENGSG